MQNKLLNQVLLSFAFMIGLLMVFDDKYAEHHKLLQVLAVASIGSALYAVSASQSIKDVAEQTLLVLKGPNVVALTKDLFKQLEATAKREAELRADRQRIHLAVEAMCIALQARNLTVPEELIDSIKKTKGDSECIQV